MTQTDIINETIYLIKIYRFMLMSRRHFDALPDMPPDRKPGARVKCGAGVSRAVTRKQYGVATKWIH